MLEPEQELVMHHESEGAMERDKERGKQKKLLAF